jgi:hypothetical protein
MEYRLHKLVDLGLTVLTQDKMIMVWHQTISNDGNVKFPDTAFNVPQ